MLPRGGTGNGKMSLNPFVGKAVIERLINFENVFVDTYVTYIVSREVVGLVSDGVIGIFH
jgi:hypothetical protein